MGSASVAAYEYWGYLIKPDKSPTPVFEQLLLSVANYISHNVAPWDVRCLTPTKLATFYRLVGGNFDRLFLETPQSSLSFVYRKLGCYHTLQPGQDPYIPPTIPALTPQGFVRWQTMQLLLEPEDHVPFLQEAVKRFDLLHPADGSPFPSILPKETLPTLPDHEVSQWYDGETQRFMQQARAAAMEELPPRPQKALSDSVASSRDSSISSDSSASTDIAEGHGGPRSQTRSSIPSNNRAQQPPPQYARVRPCIPERRRSSLPDYVHDYPSPWPRERPKSTSFPAPLRDSRPKHHSREISDSSTISTSTSDSSSRSPSPTPVRRRGQPQTLPTHRRQHSSSFPLQRPASNPQIYTGRPYQPPGASNQRKVRWQDTDNFLKNSPRFPREISRMSRDSAYGYGYANETVDERGRGRAARGVDPYVGVGGRRYQGGPPQR